MHFGGPVCRPATSRAVHELRLWNGPIVHASATGPHPEDAATTDSSGMEWQAHGP
jgi:hypothetical protein